jgi:hypothetical protein
LGVLVSAVLQLIIDLSFLSVGEGIRNKQAMKTSGREGEESRKNRRSLTALVNLDEMLG